MTAIVTPTPIPIKCISFDDELGEVVKVCDEVGGLFVMMVELGDDDGPNVVVHVYVWISNK